MVVIYQTNSTSLIPSRIKEAEEIISSIPAKHVFITGSFLYSKKYNDIDLFIITRSKKEFTHPNPLVKITKVDFNMLHTPVHHSMTRLCVSKDILPEKLVKVTIETFWWVLTSSYVDVCNEPKFANKSLRTFMLYSHYLLRGHLLDSFELSKNTAQIVTRSKLTKYINSFVPQIIRKNCRRSYIERFFYSESTFRKDVEYYSDVENYFQKLCLEIVHFSKNDKSSSVQGKSSSFA